MNSDQTYRRDPVEVREPKELIGLKKDEYTFTCASRSVEQITKSELVGSDGEIQTQQNQINEITLLLKSMGMLRASGAIEVRTDDAKPPILVELDVMTDLTEEAIHRNLTELHALVWDFMHTWPDSTFRIRSEITRTITVNPKLLLAKTSDRRPHLTEA